MVHSYVGRVWVWGLKFNLSLSFPRSLPFLLTPSLTGVRSRSFLPSPFINKIKNSYIAVRFGLVNVS
jgi:hypothetical protein